MGFIHTYSHKYVWRAKKIDRSSKYEKDNVKERLIFTHTRDKPFKPFVYVFVCINEFC